jgi:hypothetical protein
MERGKIITADRNVDNMRVSRVVLALGKEALPGRGPFFGSCQ